MPDGEAVGVPAPTARRSDPSTSHEAASLKSGTAIAGRLVTILENTCIGGPGGRLVFHDASLAIWSEEERGIVARDRGLLVEAGYVEPAMGYACHQREGYTPHTHTDECGEAQRKELGPRGRMVLMWKITDAGITEARRLREEAQRG